MKKLIILSLFFVILGIFEITAMWKPKENTNDHIRREQPVTRAKYQTLVDQIASIDKNRKSYIDTYMAEGMNDREANATFEKLINRLRRQRDLEKAKWFHATGQRINQ